MKDEDSEVVERLNNAINRCWGTTGDVLKSRYLGWPRRVMLFVLHTRYAWSYEKIRKAIGAYKVTAIAALCRSVHKKINAGPPSSRVTVTKKFRKKFDALLAQLAHR